MKAKVKTKLFFVRFLDTILSAHTFVLVTTITPLIILSYWLLEEGLGCLDCGAAKHIEVSNCINWPETFQAICGTTTIHSGHLHGVPEIIAIGAIAIIGIFLSIYAFAAGWPHDFVYWIVQKVHNFKNKLKHTKYELESTVKALDTDSPTKGGMSVIDDKEK